MFASVESALLDIVVKINTYLSNYILVFLLVAVGLWYSIKTRFVQIRCFGEGMKKVFGNLSLNGKKHDSGMTSFQALATAIAAQVGTGNIVGASGAILTGGPGAIFWMWIVAVFGMMTNYSENVLGIYYRRKNAQGEWCGGAMYYLRDGLGAKKGCKQIGAVLAVAFSLFCFLASFGIGNMTQVNSIAGNMEAVFGVPTWVSGVVVLILCALVIVGGLKRIATVTEKIVPFMVVIYMIGTIAILIMNIQMVPAVFTAIFKGAFAFKAAGGGIVGYGMKLAIEQGMKRGVFSNEAGLGSSVMVHSNSNVKEPVRQGMWGIFEVFADTMIVCTLTAFTVLSSGLVDLDTGVAVAEYGGVALTKANVVSTVFSMHFGWVGGAFVAVAIMLFAYSTVLGWSHYGSKACEYLFGTKSTIVYRVIFVIATFGGAVMGENLAWDIADTLNGMMMIPNLIGVIVLSPIVYKITRNYIDRKIKNQDVEPMLSNFDDIQKEAAAAVQGGAE